MFRQKMTKNDKNTKDGRKMIIINTSSQQASTTKIELTQEQFQSLKKKVRVTPHCYTCSQTQEIELQFGANLIIYWSKI